MTHAESFSQCASYRNNRRYYFGLFSYLNGNGNMPKQLTYNQFTEKLEKVTLNFRNPTTTKCLYGKW